MSTYAYVHATRDRKQSKFTRSLVYVYRVNEIEYGNENYRLGIEQLEFYPRNHARTTRTWILWSFASNERRRSVPRTAKFTIAFDSWAESSRAEREPLYPRYRNVPDVCNRAHRAISISTVKHLFAKLRPRERNGNNAHGAMDTSVRRIITALNTEALDISVISVFMIVAYALLVSPFPSLLSFPLSPPSFRVLHPLTFCLPCSRTQCRRRTFNWKGRNGPFDLRFAVIFLTADSHRVFLPSG